MTLIYLLAGIGIVLIVVGSFLAFFQPKKRVKEVVESVEQLPESPTIKIESFDKIESELRAAAVEVDEPESFSFETETLEIDAEFAPAAEAGLNIPEPGQSGSQQNAAALVETVFNHVESVLEDPILVDSVEEPGTELESEHLEEPVLEVITEDHDDQILRLDHPKFQEEIPESVTELNAAEIVELSEMMEAHPEEPTPIGPLITAELSGDLASLSLIQDEGPTPLEVVATLAEPPKIPEIDLEDTQIPPEISQPIPVLSELGEALVPPEPALLTPLESLAEVSESNVPGTVESEVEKMAEQLIAEVISPIVEISEPELPPSGSPAPVIEVPKTEELLDQIVSGLKSQKSEPLTTEELENGRLVDQQLESLYQNVLSSESPTRPKLRKGKARPRPSTTPSRTVKRIRPESDANKEQPGAAVIEPEVQPQSALPKPSISPVKPSTPESSEREPRPKVTAPVPKPAPLPELPELDEPPNLEDGEDFDSWLSEMVEEVEQTNDADEAFTWEDDDDEEVELDAQELDISFAASASDFTSDLEASKVPDRKLHEKAQRLARTIITDIKIYNEALLLQAKQERTILRTLGDQINRGRNLFEERVDPVIGKNTHYFEDNLIEILAEGDPTLLGSEE